MKRFFKFSLAFFLLFLFSKPIFAESDKIIAIVNQDAITQSEFNKAYSAAQAQQSQGQIPKMGKEDLKKMVLDHLIDRQLQLQLIKQAKFQVSPAAINEAIQHVASSNHVSVETLFSELNKMGISKTQYQNQLREEIALHQLQQQQIISRLTLSSTETEQLNQASPKQKQILKEKFLQKKYETELKKWLQQLRGEAYIKILP